MIKSKIVIFKAYVTRSDRGVAENFDDSPKKRDLL